MSQQPTTPPIPLAAGFDVPSEAQWRALVDKVLKGGDFTKRLVSHTADDIEIAPLYTRAHAVPSISVQRATRGWRIAQLRTETSPEALATAIAEDIEGGVEAVTIRLVAPGQTGLAADHASLDAALAAAPLERIRLSLQPGAHAIEAARSLTTIAAKRGSLGSVAALGIDPLGALARTGELVLLKPDGTGFAAALPWLPSMGTTLLADARPYHEAGASEAQEIAALAATLVAYLRCCEAEGLAPGDALPRIGLAMAVDADLFPGMAKLRAVRQVVARIAQACGASEAASRMPLAVTTSERMMARRDPWVNLLRVTTACAAAAIGGADEIAVLPHTWAIGPPDAFARRIARNTGLVLREEAGLGRIADPAGGAWYVEELSSRLAEKAWGIFQAWERAGGMQAALAGGLVQDQIAAVAETRAKDISTRRIELTGVSSYPRLGDDGVNVEPWPAASATASPIAARPHVARRLVARRLAEPFEALRDAADRLPARPAVFLANLGTHSEYSARAMWITNLLAAGGIGVIASDALTNSADAGRAFAESGATIACLCASDEVYGELGEAAAMALKGAGAARVYLAGRAGAQEVALKAAGVDGFWFTGQDAIALLNQLQRDIGLVAP